MSNHKPTPVHILQNSTALKDLYLRISSEDFFLSKLISSLDFEVTKEFSIKFCDFTNDAETGDDCLVVGEDAFYIFETNNNQFYVAVVLHEATQEDYDVMNDKAQQAIDDLKAGVPIELVVPKASQPNYLGAYVDTCEAAVKLAIQWFHTQKNKLPKEYNPPNPSRPR